MGDVKLGRRWISLAAALVALLISQALPATASAATTTSPTTPTYDYDESTPLVQPAHGNGRGPLLQILPRDLRLARKVDPVAAERGPARLSLAAEDVAGASRVNPLGGINNCVNCVIAGDATLSGARACALDCPVAQPISILERMYGGRFEPVSGRAEIETLLRNRGPGSRGIVFGSRGPDPGHVFNAVNQGGDVRFVDFQSGRGVSFEGDEGFHFLWTTP